MPAELSPRLSFEFLKSVPRPRPRPRPGEKAAVDTVEPCSEFVTRRVTTVEERIALLESAPRATGDEATTVVDTHRLDSRGALEAWLFEDALVRGAKVSR